MVLAIVLLLLVLGSIAFYFLSPWHLTPLASNWAAVDTTIQITFVVTGLVFAAVNLFLVYAIVRYRYRRDRRALYEPENKRLEAWLTGLTTVGIAALLAPGLFVWERFIAVPEDAQRVEVVGQQWHWSFRFPGEDGELGRVSTRLISEENPFGMDPEDPRGRDDVLVQSPRVRLPVDQPVQALLRSKDVIHNFQVAQFRAKMDLVPGHVSYVWLTPTRTGEFEILCAELCGIAHFAMRGMVEVVEPAEFEAWLAEQPTWGEMMARPEPDLQAGREHYATCVACHGEQGGGNRQLNAPALGGQDAWYVSRQLQNFRAGIRGQNPDDPYGGQMTAFARQLEDRAAIADLAAYIESLPVADPEPTVSGDPERGRRLYRTCAACHGADGQGHHAFNAPRLAGMSDWYLVRQLEHFKVDVRGAHAEDFYGNQMAHMARMLVDDEAVRDVVAYINTLPRRSGTEVAAAGGRDE
ncbi:c-type cytochrome [Spiribacter halobius]|uniref:cytochrome-c oxidase n=1 Tax=Sediminicurvatus halobius TaxID=2182432 RepID=A0A2U2N6C8_9GAMM|nr:c-type cytochrome [Spiribacter halobius]PWG64648.1 cytochrome-c oxidase [Spiribacter halobius]UEX79027.1 c-type cytochrome [Spiribacter halobius]